MAEDSSKDVVMKEIEKLRGHRLDMNKTISDILEKGFVLKEEVANLGDKISKLDQEMAALGAQYNILESEIASIKTVTASAIDVFKSLILKLKAAEEDYSLPEYEEDEEVRGKMVKQREITEITTKLQREKKAAKQALDDRDLLRASNDLYLENLVKLRNEYDDLIGYAEAAYMKVYESIFILNWVVDKEVDQAVSDAKKLVVQ